MGEWAPPEGCDISEPPAPNPIVGHVINRLFNMVHPPSVRLHIVFLRMISYMIWNLHVEEADCVCCEDRKLGHHD